MRKRIKIFLILGILSFIFLFQYFGGDSTYKYQDQNENEVPNISNSLEGAENILINYILRNTNLSASGLINTVDTLTILNENNNPINSILIGVPLEDASNLIFISARSEAKNTLIVERNYGVLQNFEMIKIYFDAPLLPSQEKTLSVKQSYINHVTYDIAQLEEGVTQIVNFNGVLWPILPYRCEGNIRSFYRVPKGIEISDYAKFGDMGTVVQLNQQDRVYYDLANSIEYNYLDPLLENLNGAYMTYVALKTTIQSSKTGLEIEEINREITVSPWGIIKNLEEVTIQNVGIIQIAYFTLNIPKVARNVRIFDDLGELVGTLDTSPDDNTLQLLTVQLSQNRVYLIPSSKFTFSLEYELQPQNYLSYNWLQQSISINLQTTSYNFLIHRQTTKLIIEGCSTIDYASSPPEATYNIGGTRVLVYSSDLVGSLEKDPILIKYTVDLFDLILRPIVFIMIIAALCSIFVLIIKTRKRTEEVSEFKKEFIPLTEIREFCSLYEEKNALILEIRKAESETKRKKIGKKTYKNLLAKNTAKIDQIKEEILPFKKTLMEISESYNNIIKKLDVLDAERESVDDSLNLLESRYKRGKLPSKAAYQKLSDDFFNRRKKIDRTIDKYIQQLRSYLL
ncbi:MAG: hypothetical protein EAX91_13165 [Candidatus Lokiarchaeota archaeon]|nr:hypothetical protein [Candidatus Lokiarchaeota archaeon]